MKNKSLDWIWMFLVIDISVVPWVNKFYKLVKLKFVEVMTTCEVCHALTL